MKKSIFTVLLGASLLALIIGCERKEEVAESKPGPGSVFLWGGYDDDGLFGPYVEAHGSPEYSIFGDAEEGLQKLKAGFEVDLAWPCQGEIKRWVRAGVLEPLDISRLEHWDDMFNKKYDASTATANTIDNSFDVTTLEDA